MTPTAPTTTLPTLDRPSEVVERLKALMGELRLDKMATLIDDELARFLQANEPATTLLLRLLTNEVVARREQRIERLIRDSKLPERKLLANFDFPFQPTLNKTLIMQLATSGYIKTGQGILFAGDSGVGKSFLAKALTLLACQSGHRARYTTAAGMLQHLHSGLADNTLDRKLKAYVSPALLCIDELGFDRLEQDTPRNAALFFKVIDGRYRAAAASTIVTTNIDFEALGTYLGDPVATTSIVDRILHHSVVITIKGPSWRAKESQALNRRELEKTKQPAPKGDTKPEPATGVDSAEQKITIDEKASRKAKRRGK
jgi:DNA replication protein DnaC